ncbi:MAG: Rieske (2Fe-2S) protein, partial [Bacilli bacterium]
KAMSWEKIGEVSELNVGDMKQYEIDGEVIAVYHLQQGWFATADTCTHQDCSLTEGNIVGEEIVCPCHGGAFAIKTGRATRLPCVIRLETYPIRIRDDHIEIEWT